MKLRDYQLETIHQARAELATNSRIICCLPTGAGKTVIFTEIIRAAYAKGSRVVVLCDRLQLIDQAVGKIGLPHARIQGGYAKIYAPIMFASVDALRRRELPPCDLLIVDEAHESKFDSIVQKFNCKTIGFTATPIRTGKQPSLADTYTAIIEPTNIKQLISDGYLCHATTYGAKLDRSDIAIKGNDYDAAAMFDKFNTRQLYAGTVENYRKFANNKKAIVFCVNVEHSKLTAAAFVAAGYSAIHLDASSTEAERKAALAKFATGAIQIVCNCALYTKGFDEPSIECVIVNRATTSIPLWLQMCGRGSRTHKGKNGFIIIDQGGNAHELGLWEQDREWSLHKKKKRDGDGVAPVKECPECGALVMAVRRACDFCGAEFPKVKKKLKEAEFILIAEKELPERLKKPIKHMDRTELKEYAKIKGYKAGWVWMQMQIKENYF